MNRSVCPASFLAAFIVLIALLFLAGVQAPAAIGTALQMPLGNPSGATSDSTNHTHYLIQRTVEAMDYDDALGEPLWASCDLTAGDIGSSGRSPAFYTDTTLPSSFYEVTSNDYTGSGYDRGHLCPSADRTDTDADNTLVFYMSNILPQTPDNNQGPWEAFEAYCRTLAQGGNELLIIAGGSGYNGAAIASGKAAVPGYTWKVVVVAPAGNTNVLSRIDSSTRVILEKYAFGLDPHKADKALAVSYSVQASGGTGTLTLSHRKRRFARDLSYAYEVSLDLKTWSTNGTSTPATTVIDSQTDRVSVPASAATGRALFMRVRVVQF